MSLSPLFKLLYSPKIEFQFLLGNIILPLLHRKVQRLPDISDVQCFQISTIIRVASRRLKSF